MNIRTSVEADLDRINACLADKSINTTSVQRYGELLASGAYRPEWTWLAEDGATILGLAVWWGFPDGDCPLALDGLYADRAVADPVPLWTELISRVVRAIRPGQEQPEYHFFLPPDWRSDATVVAALEPRLAAAAGAGLTETVERLRFEWTPETGVPAHPARLTFAAALDDEAFVDVFRRVAEASLDAHTRAAVARAGAEGYAREDLAIYKAMPGPRDWWRLAYDAAGELVGFAIPSANASGPVVGFLGVLPEHRGHGYVDDLLAEITAFLAGVGAQRIVADTDVTNRPMVAAFERAGYRTFAVRMVAVLPIGAKSPTGATGRASVDVVASAAVSPEDEFAQLVQRFAETPGVTTPPDPAGRGRTFGSSALKINNKIFAMLSQGTLVVKLPRDRVAALIATGDGAPFDAGKGKPMKEWLAVDPERHSRWEALTREALEFVRGTS